jgi:NAD(P)-dependent dehydrogenase (short-subunit alcohol dehydrogenase family)
MENQPQSSLAGAASTGHKRIALVTGANQGIGFEIAKALLTNGYSVFVGSRNPANGEGAAAKLGEHAYALQIDVTDQASIAAAAQHIAQATGRLDLLVNNAAISHAGKPGRTLEELMATSRASLASVEEMRAVWETNVFGVVALTQAMLPLLRKSQAARIVNVSSGVGSLTLNSDPSFPYRQGFGLTYAASKTALNAVTLAFAIELEKENIKVNAVSPGFTATALNNFQGTETVEQGSREPIRVALELDGPTGAFTGPNGPFPW